MHYTRHNTVTLNAGARLTLERWRDWLVCSSVELLGVSLGNAQWPQLHQKRLLRHHGGRRRLGLGEAHPFSVEKRFALMAHFTFTVTLSEIPRTECRAKPRPWRKSDTDKAEEGWETDI